jgi:hypothetical protein
MDNHDTIKSAVFEYANKSGSNNINATALVNILSKLLKGESFSTDDQLNRISKLEKDLETVRKRGGENDDLIRDFQENIDNLKKTVQKSDQALKDKMDMMILHYDSRVKKLEQLSTLQILQINSRERRDRSFSIKIHNYADLTMTGQPQVQHIYEKLLKPCLEEAHKRGELDEVPSTWYSAIEYGHPLGGGRETDAPRNFIIRFRSRYYLDAILKHKRVHVENLNAQNKALSRSYSEAVQAGKWFPCRLGIDTTQLDREVLTWLCRHKEVHRAYLRGQRLVFSLQNKPTQFFTVQNPYGRSLKELITPITDERKWLKAKNKLSPFSQPSFHNGSINKAHLIDMNNPTKLNPLLMEDEDEVMETGEITTEQSEVPNINVRKRKHEFTPLKLFNEGNRDTRSPVNKQLKFGTPTHNSFAILQPEIDLDAEDEIQRDLPANKNIRNPLTEARMNMSAEAVAVQGEIAKATAASEYSLSVMEDRMAQLLTTTDPSNKGTPEAETEEGSIRDVSASGATSREATSDEELTASQQELPKNQRKKRNTRNKTTAGV